MGWRPDAACRRHSPRRLGGGGRVGPARLRRRASPRGWEAKRGCKHWIVDHFYRDARSWHDSVWEACRLDLPDRAQGKAFGCHRARAEATRLAACERPCLERSMGRFTRYHDPRSSVPDVTRSDRDIRLLIGSSTYVDLFVQSQELQILNAALRDSEARAQAVLANVAEGIVTADEGGLIESFNRSARRLFGYSEEEVIGQPLGLIIAPSHHDGLSDPTPAAQSSPLTAKDIGAQPAETVGRRKDGSCFPIEMETSQMQIGERTLTIGCIRDISERKAYIEALGHQALHDALTGLPNRTLFADRMNQAIASADRAGEPRGVLVMDLDGFKRVNDTRSDTIAATPCSRRSPAACPAHCARPTRSRDSVETNSGSCSTARPTWRRRRRRPGRSSRRASRNS
jgi:PAS domain S-box-containing protein